jgi:DHA1 family bicyclomycin/chloramphenicol resistance-like MFS transporter
MPLLWGPCADYFGRRKTALVSMVLYIISTIICIFVPNIALLIVFRTTEAIGVSSLFIVGSGVIADTWKPHERGVMRYWLLCINSV